MNKWGWYWKTDSIKAVFYDSLVEKTNSTAIFQSCFSFSLPPPPWPEFINLSLTLSWRRPISYRNRSIDLRSKSMDWFLYDIGLRHERVKETNWLIIKGICVFYLKFLNIYYWEKLTCLKVNFAERKFKEMLWLWRAKRYK